jgi:2-polyprenyl-6-methoxyphenol hydroxylase-like FAD-dependent oxidoreductase
VSRPLRVIVVGGGIGGLCLAHGLRRHGIEVSVHERDVSATGRMQGYRLRISPDGEDGLRSCLPEKNMRLLAATSHERRGPGLLAYDDQLRQLWAPTFDDPRPDSADKVDAVDRATLRGVLLAGIEDAVRFGSTFVRGEQSRDRVVAHFADGNRQEADLLVAADGANSTVRTWLGIGDEPRDLGVRAVLSRTPRSAAIAAGMPELLHDQFVYVKGADGQHLGLMPMVFRTPPAEAAARLWPGLSLGPAEDYYMSVFSGHRDLFDVPDRDFFAMSGEQLRDFALRRTAAWHPDLRAIFAHAEPAETHPVALRTTLPVRPWPAGRVVPLGDAVHAMPPTGGVGANSAIRDAAVLSRELVRVRAGETGLPAALEEYQAEMVRFGDQSIRMSLRIAKWSIERFDIDETEYAPAGTAAR